MGALQFVEVLYDTINKNYVQEEQEPKEGQQEVALPQEEPQSKGAQGVSLAPT